MNQSLYECNDGFKASLQQGSKIEHKVGMADDCLSLSMVNKIALTSAHEWGRTEPEISVGSTAVLEVVCLINLCEISMAVMPTRLCVRHLSSKLYRKAGVVSGKRNHKKYIDNSKGGRRHSVDDRDDKTEGSNTYYATGWRVERHDFDCNFAESDSTLATAILALDEA